MNRTQLVEAVVILVSDLANQRVYFARIVADNFVLLLKTLERYPLSLKVVQRVADLIKHLPLTINLSNDGLLSILTEVYLLRETYETQEGEFFELITRGSSRWFQNAVWALEIIYTILLSSE